MQRLADRIRPRLASKSASYGVSTGLVRRAIPVSCGVLSGFVLRIIPASFGVFFGLMRRREAPQKSLRWSRACRAKPASFGVCPQRYLTITASSHLKRHSSTQALAHRHSAACCIGPEGRASLSELNMRVRRLCGLRSGLLACNSHAGYHSYNPRTRSSFPLIRNPDRIVCPCATLRGIATGNRSESGSYLVHRVDSLQHPHFFARAALVAKRAEPVRPIGMCEAYTASLRF